MLNLFLRAISDHALAQFVANYHGEPGEPFRKAVADHFGVSRRTVATALPRAVERGVLEVSKVPALRNMKSYAVAAGYQPPAAGEFRRLVDLGVSRKSGFLKMLDNYDLTYGKGMEYLELGVLAYCESCGFARHLSPHVRPAEPPVCPHHPQQRDGELWVAREMISAWSLGLLEEAKPQFVAQEKPPPNIEEIEARLRARGEWLDV